MNMVTGGVIYRAAESAKGSDFYFADRNQSFSYLIKY